MLWKNTYKIKINTQLDPLFLYRDVIFCFQYSIEKLRAYFINNNSITDKEIIMVYDGDALGDYVFFQIIKQYLLLVKISSWSILFLKTISSKAPIELKTESVMKTVRGKFSRKSSNNLRKTLLTGTRNHIYQSSVIKLCLFCVKVNKLGLFKLSY